MAGGRNAQVWFQPELYAVAGVALSLKGHGTIFRAQALQLKCMRIYGSLQLSTTDPSLHGKRTEQTLLYKLLNRLFLAPHDSQH
jgi:hypothetical protein